MPRQHTLLATLIIILGSVYLILRRRKDSPISAPVPQVPIGTPVYRQRLVAVGDLHGDINNAQKVLKMAKVIDSDNRWTAGNDILVQTGDIVDRGTYALDIYLLMQNLRSQASAAGGRVVSILGNHEVMNAIGDWRYVTEADIRRFGSTEKRQKDLSTEGWLGQEWLANYSTTALVPMGPNGAGPTMSFTHGSLRPSFPYLQPYPDSINALGQSLLRKALTPPLALPYPPNPYSGLPKGATTAEAQLYDSGGPFWWRGLAQMEDETVVCGWARELQKTTGARRIIGGHTPNFDRIVDRCNASVIIIDTGISSAYGGILSALEIIYTLTPRSVAEMPDHRQDPFIITKLRSGQAYVEREEVYAIYPQRKDLLTVETREITL